MTSIKHILAGVAITGAVGFGVAACGGSSAPAAAPTPATPQAAPTGPPDEASVVSTWNSIPGFSAKAATLVAVAANAGETYQCNIGPASDGTPTTMVELYVPGSNDMPSAQFNFNADGTRNAQRYAPGTMPGGSGDTCTLNTDGTLSTP